MFFNNRHKQKISFNRFIYKSVVAFIFLPMSFIAFAVECHENADGTWTCTGDAGNQVVVTNIVGTCSNCVAMTIQECKETKERIWYNTSDIHQAVTFMADDISAAYRTLKDIEDDINTWDRETYKNGTWTSQMYYCMMSDVQFSSPQESATAYEMCGEALYDYGQQVKYALNNYAEAPMPILKELSEGGGGIGEVNNIISTLGDWAQSIDCSACTASWDDPGGSGGGGGGGGCDSCLCTEQWVAIDRMLNLANSQVASISNQVSKLTNTVTHIYKDIHEIVEQSFYVTNFVHRLDDWVFDDLTNQVFQIYTNARYLANSFSNQFEQINIGFYSAFSNANSMVAIHWDDSPYHSEDSEDWKELGRIINNKTRTPESGMPNMPFPADTDAIDFEVYQRLNWFQRIEYLLGRQAGIFEEQITTNAEDLADSDFDNSQKQQFEQVSNSLDDLESVISTPLDTIKDYFDTLDGLRSKINPFSAIFENGSDLQYNDIVFLPKTEFDIGDDEKGGFKLTIPKIALSQTEGEEELGRFQHVFDVAHALTGFLWVITTFVLVLVLFIRVFKILLALLNWYRKIYQSWVHSNFLL